MERVLIDKFLSALETANVTEYWLDCGSKGISFFHDGVSSFIKYKDDYAVWFEKTRNIGNDKGQFNIEMVPYEYIDGIRTNDATFLEGLSIADSLGIKDAEMDEYFKNLKVRQPISSNPRGAGEGPYLDINGKDTLPPGRTAMVTY